MAAVAILCSAAGIAGDYTLDDGRAVLGHPAVTGDVGVWEVFGREFWGRPLGEGWSSSYRPLTSLGFALEHRITAEAWIHHLGNVVLYAALCAAVARFARRWCDGPIAAGVGVVFAVLPVHVENVASIVGRADVLAALFGLGALALAVPERRDGARDGLGRRAIGAGGLYACALLSKESVALVPAMAAWLAWVKVRPRTLREGWAFAPTLALSVVGLGYLAARQQWLPVALPETYVAADNLLMEREGLTRVWGNLAVLGHYAELVFVPRRLCADHTYGDVFPPVTAFGTGAVWAWIGLGLGVVFVRDAVRALRRRGDGLGVALLIAYALMGQWVIDLSVIVAERLALWPSVWLVLWVGAAASGSIRQQPVAVRRRIAVLVGVLAALAGARSVQRTLAWSDGETLQRSSLASCPAAVHSRFILANLLRERGAAEEAVWHYGVAGAGRAAFPEPFEVDAFEAEATEALHERLPRLPRLVGAPDERAYWAGLHAYLLSQGATAEARVVQRIATAEAR